MKKRLNPFVFFLVAVLMVSFVLPHNVDAKTTKYYSENNLNSKADELISILEELDNNNIDMENLDNNTEKSLNHLSYKTRKFYKSYKDAVENGENGNKFIVGKYLNIDQSKLSQSNSKIAPRIILPFSYKKYKVSESKIKKINSLAKKVGLGAGLLTAIAKAFKKSPTYRTLLIGAVGSIGLHALNSCDKHKKGIYIEDYRFGATHSFQCKPVK
ncbi:hypothetical protein JOD45_002997 [Scopulibacillus daqui]|uniref:Uncharacterized protein n=1 Tax=Scopulibacillus daqui TaxID=1469162 RepID=A0ABS2Q3F5_9BACL|nr:hypothetical protein [Scopulibacillus daqui]MBM7646763.1 hypothetical protein [Scopulibacillus daqui]